MKKIIIAVALIAVAAFVLITNGHKATVTGEASPEPVVETMGTASAAPEAVQAPVVDKDNPLHLVSNNNAKFAPSSSRN